MAARGSWRCCSVWKRESSGEGWWRRTVVEEQTYLKHRTVCLKLVTMVNFMHFLPHFKKEGAGGRGTG